MSLTGKTIGQLTFLETPTEDTLIPVELNGETYHIAFSGITSYTEITYDELYSAYTGSTLNPGKFYLITDFQTCYDQPNYDSESNPITVGNYKTGTTEPLMVFATSANTLATQAYSPQYPLDKISYDISFNVTEVTSSPAKGRIIERIDNKNNRADYDFRAVQFIRYEGFFSEQYYSGRLSIDLAGLVTGVNTSFDSNFIEGDILGVYYPFGASPMSSFRYYEILTITSPTEMNVTGASISEVSNTFYSQGVSLPQHMNPFQCNVTSSNFTGFSEYYTFNNDDNFNTYLGNNINYYIFLLSNNVFLSGQYENNYFAGDVVGNTFNDDMDSNQCGPYFEYNIITNDFDDNVVGAHFSRNIIDCDMDGNIIGESFQSNMIGDNDGQDFDYNRIGAQFSYNFLTLANDTFMNNDIGRNFSSNIIDSGFEGNNIQGDFTENIIINSNFTTNTIQEGFFNNFINSSFTSNIIAPSFYNNNFSGTSFVNNNIASNFNANNIYNLTFSDNEIGYGFNNNNIYSAFIENVIRSGFNTNLIYNSFLGNDIKTDFESNLLGVSEDIGGYEFANNRIGDTFKSNQITGGTFSRNVIGPQFLANNVYGDFLENNIKYNFFLNIIDGLFQSNNIGVGFDSNETYGSFTYNTIGDNFYNNNIQDGFGFGGGSYRGNVIGNSFTSNNIGEYFYTNRITDNFTNNTIGDYFQNNDITYNGLNAIDFTTYYNGVVNTSSAGGNGGSDGTWVGVTPSSTTLSGTGASFDITTFGGLVTLIVINTPGKFYQVGEQLTIDGASIGGAANLVITVDSLTETPIVYTTANSTISNSIDNFALITTLDYDTLSLYISDTINGPFNP